jgi:tetratricopeptide (TPR) repeat protein
MSTSLKASAAKFLVMLTLGSGVSLAQNLRNSNLPLSPDRNEPPKPVSAPQSAMEARLGSYEIEEGRINEVYQEVVKIHLHGDFGGAAEMYRSLVIPMAERTQSDVTRRKFLFLSYRGLGNCYLAMSRFNEAEETFQKLFEYLPLRPGVENSDYPINFESIAMARMGQQRWQAAEESLQKAVSIFEDQIEHAVTLGSEPAQNDHANRLRLSEVMALNLFAVVYFREQRYAEALQTLERAYNQGVVFGAPQDVLQQTVSDGRAVSIAAADEDAIATWSKRDPERPISQ